MFNRSGFVFFSTSVLLLCAGFVIGRLWGHTPVAVATPAGKQPSWIADQLGLSAAQRQQMDAIWDETKQKIGSAMDRRHAIDHERDDALRKLLTPEQAAAWEKTSEGFRSQRAAFDKDREKLIHEADERSRALLDETQKKKWDMLRQGHDRRWQHGPSSQRSATGPGMSPGGHEDRHRP